ncbi:tetratricopeptide repeat protein [Striga asiatica]|uniref:Tetratricopeptide repeat protein n=1 Tax=Striga asiatica TaxID=4170 RepID=A0A5A7NXE5_STRAF|nr:tetratricopeptide repeat protein [Striga asiatica]
MSRIPELTSLFATFASNLQARHPTADNEVDLSVANLNRTLNLSEAPRVRVLDTALSLMGFTAPQVYDSGIEFTLRTIIAVLRSSIECKVLKVKEEQVLRVGGLVSKRDCVDVMEWCSDILRKLNGHKGNLCASLSYYVIRVAALACSYASDSNLKMNMSGSSTCALANLVGCMINEFTFENGKVPLRLMLWQLDPIILKQDISNFLRETMERPFLSLGTEIFGRTEWKSIMICLVISPSMFIETRALLHNWFLMTRSRLDFHYRGLASIMELQTEFVVQLLDIISRPMWWEISMEIGSKLPFSHAYFPHEHSLLRTLAGPISQEHIKLLLAKICGSDSRLGGRKTTTKIGIVDHKSKWAMVMNFPGWFFFASMLLFSYIGHKDKTCPAKFIAWILDPTRESSQRQAADCLVKVTDLWPLKCSSSSEKKNEETRIHKPGRRLKLQSKDGLTSQDQDILPVSLWLKEFQDTYTKISRTKVDLLTSNSKGFIAQQNLLFRRIPLGILLACPNHLGDAWCSLLLHYAATGNLQKSKNMSNPGMSQKRWKNDVEWDPRIELYTKRDAIAGCKTVFDITDIAEIIAQSMLQSEDEGLDFVYRLKLKIGYYLLKCVDRLLQIKLDECGPQMKRDLLARIIRWKHQGKIVFENNKDVDRVCDALNCANRFLPS